MAWKWYLFTAPKGELSPRGVAEAETAVWFSAQSEKGAWAAAKIYFPRSAFEQLNLVQQRSTPPEKWMARTGPNSVAERVRDNTVPTPAKPPDMDHPMVADMMMYSKPHREAWLAERKAARS